MEVQVHVQFTRKNGHLSNGLFTVKTDKVENAIKDLHNSADWKTAKAGNKDDKDSGIEKVHTYTVTEMEVEPAK